jgi:hypothetical protein
MPSLSVLLSMLVSDVRDYQVASLCVFSSSLRYWCGRRKYRYCRLVAAVADDAPVAVAMMSLLLCRDRELVP